jgi:arsenite methyltransferase
MTDPSSHPDLLRTAVRERYAAVADGTGSCCSGCDDGCGCDSSCCAPAEPGAPGATLGYSLDDLALVPAGANLGLGCGNPTALLTLQPGEVVLDLGSGGGIDCFVAAHRVGPTGRVIGVDMTPEMIQRARVQAEQAGITSVEFRLGEIEHLPVADGVVDVVLSNCVINLVPDVGQVYREAFRVLRPGGRLAVADVVATRPIPPEVRKDPARWASCSAGARSPEEIAASLRAAGFTEVAVEVRAPGPAPASLEAQDDLGVVSGSIRATKPRAP